MLRKMKAGETSQSLPLFVQDTTSTTGGGLGSLVFNTSGLAAKYRRQGQSAWTTITLQTMTLGTWASGGFVSDGGVTGGYEFGLPDAVIAAGVEWAEVQIYGAANMLPVIYFLELDAVNYQDATRMGLAALPNANAGAVGGLPLSVDASGRGDVLKINGVSQTGLDLGGTWTAAKAANLDAAVSSRMATYVQPTGFLAATFPAGTIANTTNLTAGTIATVTNDVGITQAAADKVWASAARTLTSFGTLVADAAAAVWAAAGRTLTAFGFTVNTNPNTTETAVKAKTDNLPADPVSQTYVGSAASAILTAVGTPQQSGVAVTLPGIPANWITAGGIAAGALNGKGDWLTVGGYTAPPTVLQIDTQLTGTHGAGAWGGGSGSAPTVDQIRAGVWGDSDTYPVGSKGRQLAAAGAAADPLANPVPGAYPSGTAGNVLGHIDLGGITYLSTTPPVAGPPVRVVRGDDYLSADGRALRWQLSSLPDLTGAAVEFRVNGLPTGSVSLSGQGSAAQVVTVELTKAQTAALSVGLSAYTLRATLADGSVWTLTPSATPNLEVVA